MSFDKDQVREALEWWDEDNPGKPWYMDPAKELWERRGKQDKWGRITTDAIYILLHVRDRIESMHQVARAFVDGSLLPAEPDYEERERRDWFVAEALYEEVIAYNIDIRGGVDSPADWPAWGGDIRPGSGSLPQSRGDGSRCCGCCGLGKQETGREEK